MDVEEAIRNRRSIRAFKPKELPEGTAEKLIELANLAPSAGNLQARDFIIVTDQKIKDELTAAALDQDFISQAPVDIVVIANKERIGHYGHRGQSLYIIQDSAAAIQNILLAVHAMGLASVWIGAFNEDRAIEILGLPEHARPVAILPIGYPDERPPSRGRIPIDELIHYNKW